MKTFRARGREGGGLLLTVMLLLAMLAALTFGLHRAAGMDAQAVSAEYDKRNAMYLAKAAIATAKWMNQISACSSAGVSNLAFAGGTITGTIAKPGTKTVTITGSGTTASGATATLSLTNFHVVNFSTIETKNMTGAADTYIDPSLPSMKDDTVLVLASGTSNVLLQWSMSAIPGDADVLSAQLILSQNGGSATARTVTVHRVTTSWDGSATWTRARAGSPWVGGAYATPVLASTDVQAGSVYTWDVTGLVDGWDSGRLSNYGMLLRLPNPGQSVTFSSQKDATASLRPILRATYAKPC